MKPLGELFGIDLRVNESEELWHFDVHCPRADRVLLQTSTGDHVGGWVAMQAHETDQWQARLQLPPGQYRVRHLIVRGDTIINGGGSGLIMQRLDLADAG